jgi:hypothetical protein
VEEEVGEVGERDGVAFRHEREDGDVRQLPASITGNGRVSHAYLLPSAP